MINLATVYPEGPVTGGTIIGAIVLAILLILCILLFMWGLAKWDDHFDGGLAKASAIGAPILAVVCFGFWLWSMWPLSYEYHHWIPVNGKVEQVSKRLKSCGDGCVEQRYVVIVHGKPYGIDDTRAALLHEGSNVSIRCKKEYEYGTPRGAHGWACKWAERS